MNISDVDSVLKNTGFIELRGTEDMLIVFHNAYFDSYVIELNGRAMHSYKSISGAIRKINQYINRFGLKGNDDELI
tara:strand:- start:34 stop:261 length:228 start_codon:yes stop_codon:yes gene_type:complete